MTSRSWFLAIAILCAVALLAFHKAISSAILHAWAFVVVHRVGITIAGVLWVCIVWVIIDFFAALPATDTRTDELYEWDH